jgi:hypothetical protein
MGSSMRPNIYSSEAAPRANWLAGIEAAVVFLLIMAYIWWLRFRYPYAWIAILALVVASQVRHGDTPGALGFRWTETPRSVARFSALLAVAVVPLVAGGMIFHTMRRVSWQGAFLSLEVYCVWGLFQQYLLNGYFVNRFSEFLPADSRNAVPALAGVFFSLAHLPNWFLMIVTLGAGYLCARIYLEYRNLYLLGLAHGIIGFLIYLVAPDTITHHLYVGPKWFSM